MMGECAREITAKELIESQVQDERMKRVLINKYENLQNDNNNMRMVIGEMQDRMHKLERAIVQMALNGVN